MIEPGHRSCLPQEPRARRVALACAQQLDRDAALEIEVDRGMNNAHATGSQLVFEPITAENHRAGERSRRRQSIGRRRFGERIVGTAIGRRRFGERIVGAATTSHARLYRDGAAVRC
ncbi:MAG: hypothetical protein AB7P03_30190 [Kofleriaceae bacterium]